MTYRDYDTEQVPSGNMFNYFVSKRISFKHEQEVRVVCTHEDWGRIEKRGLITSRNNGVNIPIDLSALVNKVVLAPTVPDWVETLIGSTLKQFDLKFPFEKSTILVKSLWSLIPD